jgi:hypothetical protein
MSGPVNLLDAFPFGGSGVSVKVGGQKKLGTGGQEMAPVEVKVAGQMDMEGARRRRRRGGMSMEGARRRRHTKKGGQAAMEGARRRRRHTKKGGQAAMEGARRRKSKKGGMEGARRHRSRKH